MDLFNKKKLAALRDELTLTTANLEATTKELADLKEAILNNFNELTEYFKPKYVNKYYSIELNGKTVYLQCTNLQYTGGVVLMMVAVSGRSEIDTLALKVSELKNLKVVTKKEYTNQGKETE